MRALRWFIPVLSLTAFTCGGGGASDDSTGAVCSDGIDNDGDGLTDFPEDPGCTDAASDSEETPTSAQCNDDIDNDGDGLIDYPADPGCFAPQADDERDECPGGRFCAQCANGIDDDGNGSMDYPMDPGCEAAGDTIEYIANPIQCGGGLVITQLPPTGVVTGTFDATSNTTLTSPCGAGNGMPAFAYQLYLTEPKVIVASTDHPETETDTKLDVRSATCAEMDASLACNDNIASGNTRSSVTHSLLPGTYFFVVSGPSGGKFKLQVDKFNGEGVACTMQPDCGPGLVCRTPINGTAMVCSQPVCNDGLDDDGDMKIDYPNDPGCESPADDTEGDTCPGVSATCPQCGDGVDNDGDGQTDYPADTSCTSASGGTEACAGETDPILPITSATTMGTLVGATDGHDPSCGSNGGADRLFTLQIPALATLVMDTNGSAISDTILSFMDNACTEPSIECDDDDSPQGLLSLISRTNVPAGNYVIAVDAYSSFTTLNTFVLNVRGTVAQGGSCEGGLFASGALTCITGQTCQGTAGARTCLP